MNVGIDAIGFYTPNLFLDLKDLANARSTEPNKFYKGLGQFKMSIPTQDEDIVTMAAEATRRIINDKNKNDIDAVLFATESSIDQSKSAGLFLHGLLELNSNCRVVEIKQSCYGGVGAMQLGLALVKSNMSKKVLLIASDIAKYGLNTKGESTQGAGAIAMILSRSPRIIKFEEGSGVHTEDAMDFWRPNYSDEAIVYGRYSCDLYLKFLYETWNKYTNNTSRKFLDHDHFCYHISIPRLVTKSHANLYHYIYKSNIDSKQLSSHVDDTLIYSRILGNCYTASINIGLISLLDNNIDNLSNKRIGFYSYGSGSIAEFFSGIICKDYYKFLDKQHNQEMLKNRRSISIEEYEKLYSYTLPVDGSNYDFPLQKQGYYRLTSLQNHKRIYVKM